ncbi:MAG: DoxX family protein [Verrucomicrobia bacterium]|nr:DoxX family protein [Verrucomicrobiota bacterium]
MKHVPNVLGGLLGLAFIVFGLNFFLQFIEIPPPPADSHAAAFMGAMYATGFLKFVKILEIAGGVMVAIPWTRRLGLLILTPIIVNIVAFHFFYYRRCRVV